MVLEQLEEYPYQLILDRGFDARPNGAVLQAAQSRVENAHVKVAVHTDGDELAAIEGHGVHLVVEGEVLLGVAAGVVGAVCDILSDIVIVALVNLVAGVQIGHAYRHAVLIRGEQKVYMAVVELHGVVVTSQQLKITDDI